MGHLARVLPMLIDFDIWKQLFADIRPNITAFIELAAKNTDHRIQIGKTINPAFFYAVLLWEPFLERYEFYSGKGIVAAEARAQAGLDVLKRQATRTVIPRFAETFIREVWEMQSRLLNPKPQQIEALASHARFRAGFDFLLLREKAGDPTTQEWGNGGMLTRIWELMKRKTISQYNRQRAKNRRKQNEDVLDEVKHLEIEPLVDIPEQRSRRARKARKPEVDHEAVKAAESVGDFNSDHPIMKRKRVKRDLSQVVFGPTQ